MFLLSKETFNIMKRKYRKKYLRNVYLIKNSYTESVKKNLPYSIMTKQTTKSNKMGKHLNRNFSKDNRMATSSCKDIQYHESFKTTKSQYRALAGPCSSLAGGKAELYDRFREQFAVSRELKCTHHRILRL